MTYMHLHSFADSPVVLMPYKNIGTLFVIDRVNKAPVSPDEGILLYFEFTH